MVNMDRSVAFTILLEVSPTFGRLTIHESADHITTLVDLYREKKLTHSMWDLGRDYAMRTWGEGR